MPSKVKQFSDLVHMAPKVPTLHWRLLTVVRLARDGGRFLCSPLPTLLRICI